MPGRLLRFAEDAVGLMVEQVQVHGPPLFEVELVCTTAQSARLMT